MNKECPHCGVDDFGLWDLCKLTFAYSDPLACRNCGGLVCNSGSGQFLTLLATAVLLVLDFVILYPLVPEWIIISSLLVLMPLPIMLFARPVPAVTPKDGRPHFTPDSNNDKAIIVSGWNAVELGQALADFARRDSSGSPPKIGMHERFETLYELTFPEDISALDFIALVNYLNYPINLGSPDRQITVAGKTTLNSSFAGIPNSLLGTSAIFYVPKDDQDYDVVYLQVETKETFANSFNQKAGWRRVKEPRLSGEVDALSWLREIAPDPVFAA